MPSRGRALTFRAFSEKVKREVIAYWKRRQHDPDGFWSGDDPLSDAHVYTRDEWLRRGEAYCNDAVAVIVTEGPLYGLVNEGWSEEELDRFNEFLETLGLYWDLGTGWMICLMPLDPARVPALPTPRVSDPEGLADQIRYAYDAASAAIAGQRDVGSSNLDNLLVNVPPDPKLLHALARRGIIASASGRTRVTVLGPGGQASTRTAGVEVMARELEAMGLDVFVQHIMD